MRDFSRCEYESCNNPPKRYLVLLDARKQLEPLLCAMCYYHTNLYTHNLVNHIFTSLQEAETFYIKETL